MEEPKQITISNDVSLFFNVVPFALVTIFCFYYFSADELGSFGVVLCGFCLGLLLFFQPFKSLKYKDRKVYVRSYWSSFEIPLENIEGVEVWEFNQGNSTMMKLTYSDKENKTKSILFMASHKVIQEKSNNKGWPPFSCDTKRIIDETLLFFRSEKEKLEHLRNKGSEN